MAKTGHPNVVIVHALLWKGAPHAWQTVYNLSGATPDTGTQQELINQLVGIETQIFPAFPSVQAGFIEGRFYTGQGGPPTVTVPFGTLDTPSTWTGYNNAAAGWPADQDQAAPEVCFMVETPLSGLSSTGKPVKLRKFFHAVPIAASGAGEIASGIQTGINGQVIRWTNGSLPGGYVVISESGRQSSGPPTVQLYLSNHQMPRGRKRKTTTPTGAISTALDGVASALQGAFDAVG